MRFTLVILMLGVVTGYGQATVDFSQTGVEGGIPYYPNAVNVVTDYSADNTGATDSYSAFTNAIAHCTNRGAVYIPAGTYYLGTAISMSYTQQVVLRGAGPTNTLIISGHGGSSPKGGINFASDTDRATPTLSSGYTAGSYTLEVSSASGITSNHLAQIKQDNDPLNVFGSLSTPSTQWQRQMARITNVSGTTIMIDQPLNMRYSNSYSPVLWAFSKSVSWSGVEELTLRMTNGTPHNGLYFYIANNCWATNVVVTNSVYANINVAQSYRISVVGCLTRNHQAYDSTTRYGLQLTEFSSSCRVEDSTFQGNNLCLTVQQGANGNVVAYNFADEGFGTSFPSDSAIKGYLTAHGDFSHHNLFEGNVVPAFSTDEFWGVNTTNTTHRNWFTRVSKYNTTGSLSPQGAVGIFVDATNYHMQFTGNIIGHPRDSLITNSVWSVGFARRQGNELPDTPWDSVTTNTLTKTGNYDFSTNGTFWASGSVETLTNSYYLTSKPGWFGNLTWPPLGPDVNVTSTITNSAVIPAQARYYGVDFSANMQVQGRFGSGISTPRSRR